MTEQTIGTITYPRLCAFGSDEATQYLEPDHEMLAHFRAGLVKSVYFPGTNIHVWGPVEMQVPDKVKRRFLTHLKQEARGFGN